MKTKNKKYGFKRFLVGGMLALSVFSTSFLVSNFENKLNNAPVVYANYQETLSNISNADFSSYSSATDPYTPNNWTLNNPTNSDSIKTGVINVYDTVFPDKSDEYELSTNPNYPAGNPNGSTDPLYKHLMINSYAGFSRAGYSSSSFTLEANSYYSVSVTLRTNDQAKASIYISGLSDSSVDAEITNISTFNYWTTYTLFIETNQFKSESATLELWLGGKEQNQTAKGAVFFNKVSLTKYSENTFVNNINNSDPETTKTISLFTPVYESGFITNSTFNETPAPGEPNAISGWETIESAHNKSQVLKTITTSNYNPDVDTAAGIANPGTNFKTNDSSVLFMQNKESGKQGIKSNEFVIKQNELYMISVWAKSDCAVGNGATFKVEEVNPDKSNTEFTPNTISVSASTSVATNKSTNNWTQYKIFVEGHPLKDTSATLQIWLGTEGNETNGYVFVDDITVQKVTYATYKSGSTTGTSATYTYNTNNTQFIVPNGNFNVSHKTEATLTYPLEVGNWTLNNTDENYNIEENLSGIINTNSTEFEKLNNYIKTNNIGVTVNNPGLTPIQQIAGATLSNSSNNILMIGNIIKTSQNYKSDTFSLTASTYYKITMLVNTQFTTPVNTTDNTGAEIKLQNSSFTALDLKNINTNGEWQKISIYAHTGSNITDYNISLALNNVQGFVFFDDVAVETSSEEAFNATKQNNEYKVELAVETNDSFDLTENSDSALSTLYNWTASNSVSNSNPTYGALNTTKNTASVFAGITNPGSVTGNNVLAIYSNVDTNFKMSAKQKIKLAANNYYKVSVSVKTVNISQENKKYDADGNLINFGANIALNGFTDSFKAINTEQIQEINNYVTYSFYINPTSETETFVELSLGEENNLASGYVFFDDVTVTTLEQAAYNEQTSNLTNKMLMLTAKAPDTEPAEEPDEFVGSEFNWVIVPSILLALAIVIAIIGTMFRHVKFTKTPKIKTKYDRRKTVEVDLNKRERIELRNAIIDELQKESNDIAKELSQLEKDFNKETSEIKREHDQKVKAYEEVKQQIIVEREKATREYNDKLNATENLTQEDKQKFEKEYKALIKQLDKRANAEAKKFNKKDSTLQTLQAKYNQKASVLTEKQDYIKTEIAEIENEIAEIKKKKDIKDNKLTQVKEDVKKQKLEKLTKSRKEKSELNKTEEVENSETENSNQSDLQDSNTTSTEDTTSEVEQPKVEQAEVEQAEETIEVEVVKPDSDKE